MYKYITRINSNIRNTLDDILNYATECRDKIISYKPDNEDIDSYYTYYKDSTLKNIISMTNRAIKLYDNENTFFNKLMLTRLNDILRVSIEEIRDNAISYRTGLMSFSVPDDEKIGNANQYELLRILNSIIDTADTALLLYTCDIMRHSSDDKKIKNIFNIRKEFLL